METCFQQALQVVCQQQGRSLELRAATSVARLWSSKGQTAQARQLLEPVYNWFSEGINIIDLKEAKALLEAMTVGD